MTVPFLFQIFQQPLLQGLFSLLFKSGLGVREALELRSLFLLLSLFLTPADETTF